MAEKKTGKTAKTSKPVKTTKTIRTTKATKPVKKTKTARTTKAAKPIKSTKTAKAVKPVKSVETTKPAEVPRRTNVVYDIDAYSPPQIAARLDAVAGVKAKDSTANTLLLGINAGAFIALGAQFATLVISDSGLHSGLTAVVGAIVFCLGLIMVVVGGAELFTGNCMIFIGY
ncbi:MAG: formate/nitrite transporter family protein, partial [Candidatus Brocadiaceae bacterium]|nr:formate/nitrite transporter family protein [Candidatus Brocadiaceae bacterium]